MDKKLLIVDDEPHIRMLIGQTLEDLEDEDVEFFTADNGQTALELISAAQSERGWAPPAFRLIEQVMKAGYEDAFVVGGTGPGETWTALEPDRRIDYIFYPAAWSGVRVSSRRWEAGPAVEASDHLPVLAEFA